MLLSGKLYILGIITLTLANFCLANIARTCHVCEGINCLRTTANTERQCLDPLDICVTIFEEFNVIRKGCFQEIPIELRRRCNANTAECHKCNTDRCNSLGQTNFACLQCDSKVDINCSQNPTSLKVTRCATPTAPNSYCYVKYVNNVTTRGCATTVAEQKDCYGSSNCMLCSPGDINSCNNVDFTPENRAKINIMNFMKL